MPLKPEELDLAINCFGYGSWRAKYWFVGLEERLDPSEKSDCTKRAEAFRELNIEGLCDLKKFHEKIGEERWQRSLQFTWGRMIWLLKNYLAEDSGHCALLRYQSQSLGSSTGETCVTELSGLPRDSSSNGNGNALLSNNKTVFEAVRNQRIEVLRDKIQRNEPELVIFYGKTQEQHWNKIAGCDLQFRDGVKRNKTTFVFVPHPNARVARGEWCQIAERLAKLHV